MNQIFLKNKEIELQKYKIILKRKIINTKEEWEEELKKRKMIRINPRIFFFIKKIQLKHKKKYKKFLLSGIIIFFLLRVTCWDYLVNYSMSRYIIKKLNKYFKKFNIFLLYYIWNDWIFHEGGKCYLTPIFKLRNFFLVYLKYDYFKYITTGLVTKKKKNRISKNYQIMLYKIFFSNFAQKLLRYVNLNLIIVSKRIHFVFFYLNFYLKKFNNEIYKYHYFMLENIYFPNYRTAITVKMPKKPSKKKFIIKRQKKYYF